MADSEGVSGSPASGVVNLSADLAELLRCLSVQEKCLSSLQDSLEHISALDRPPITATTRAKDDSTACLQCSQPLDLGASKNLEAADPCCLLDQLLQESVRLQNQLEDLILKLESTSHQDTEMAVVEGLLTKTNKSLKNDVVATGFGQVDSLMRETTRMFRKLRTLDEEMRLATKTNHDLKQAVLLEMILASCQDRNGLSSMVTKTPQLKLSELENALLAHKRLHAEEKTLMHEVDRAFQRLAHTATEQLLYTSDASQECQHLQHHLDSLMREADTVRSRLQRLRAQEEAVTTENYALKQEILARSKGMSRVKGDNLDSFSALDEDDFQAVD